MHLNNECSILSAPFLHAPSHSILNKVVTIIQAPLFIKICFPLGSSLPLQVSEGCHFLSKGPGVSNRTGEGDCQGNGHHCNQIIWRLGRWGSEVFSLALITDFYTSCAPITTADIAIVKHTPSQFGLHSSLIYHLYLLRCCPLVRPGPYVQASTTHPLPSLASTFYFSWVDGPLQKSELSCTTNHMHC